MLFVHWFMACASVVIVVFFWTSDSEWIERLLATGIVAASIALMFTTVHFLVPFLMQAVVGVWAMIRIQYG
jgi:hypothetical protein